jgi:hypothetical protein
MKYQHRRFKLIIIPKNFRPNVKRKLDVSGDEVIGKKKKNPENKED